MIGDIERRWTAEGSKRLLVISAPGADGALLAAGALEALEAGLRPRDPNVDDFTLSTYFDLVVGAGHGAVLALKLALGAKAAEAGRTVRAIAEASRKPGALETAARAAFGDAALGELDWRTGYAAPLGRIDDLGRLLRADRRSPAWDGGEGALGERLWLARRFVAAAIGGALDKPLEVALDGKAARGLFVDPAITPDGDPAAAAARMIAGRRLPGAFGAGDAHLCVHLVVTPPVPAPEAILKRARSGKGARAATKFALADAGVEAGLGALDAVAPSLPADGAAGPRLDLVRWMIERNGEALAAHLGAPVPKTLAAAWDKGEAATDAPALLALGRKAGEASFDPRQFPHGVDPIGFLAPRAA